MEVGVVVDLVNCAIKYALFGIGYAAAMSDQDKVIQEFLQGQGCFHFTAHSLGKSLYFTII